MVNVDCDLGSHVLSTISSLSPSMFYTLYWHNGDPFAATKHRRLECGGQFDSLFSKLPDLNGLATRHGITVVV